MKISKEIFVNVNTVKYSVCGKFLAFGSSDELSVVRIPDGITVLKVQCSGKIKRIEWSTDCDHVLCVIANKNVVELFSISSPKWNCVIREGPIGLLTAAWSPKGTHVVTVAEFAARLSVWSLVGRSVAFIETPLIRAKNKLSFSEDGNHLALISGNFGNFKISVFSTISWTTATQIPCTNAIYVPSTPLWSRDGFYLAVWETVDYERCLLEIYDVKTGKKRGHFNSGQINKLGGISSVVWCPNGQFLMIDCLDDCIYILGYLTWSVLKVFSHKTVIDGEKCDIFRETTIDDLKFFNFRQRPAKFTSIRPSTQAGHKFHAIKTISISNDGLYVASQSHYLPAVVWMWTLKTLSLTAVIALKNQVTDFAWSGSSISLMICDGSDRVTLWRPCGRSVPEKRLILAGLNLRRKVKKAVWRPQKTGKDTELLFLTNTSMLIVSNFA